MKDKNGKEIEVGDRVKFYSLTNGNVLIFGKVIRLTFPKFVIIWREGRTLEDNNEVIRFHFNVEVV